MAKAPGWPTLKMGYISVENICALQCLLNYRNGNNALSVTGSYDQNTYNAVYAYQAANSLGADGVAGVGTLSKLTENLVVKEGFQNNAARAAQYLISKFENINITGNFDSNSDSLARSFQSKMAISVDGKIGPTSWQYLFGHYFYPVVGCDTATTLDASKIQALANKGMTFVGRYLPGSNYPITVAEKNLLLSKNFSIVSIWEKGSPTSVNYFSSSRGTSDAKLAISGATSIGQPTGTPIYFAVDYDATEADVSGKINDYITAIIAEFNRQNNPYKVGLYGSGAVLEYFRSRIIYTMLACARGWRGTTAFSRFYIRQYTPTTITSNSGSFAIDENDAYIYAGAWR